ncbi:MAG: TRAP transporter small permease [Thermodesulfobacteriota bacterium]
MIRRLLSYLNKGEELLLVALLLLLMIIVAAQIIMRNLMGSGLIWADGLTRTLVLWLGLLGAMVATRDNNHINIDILSRFLPAKTKTVVSGLTLLFTSGICAVTCYYACYFVALEYHFQTPAFDQVPAWLCEMIIPLAFGVMGLRCLLLAALALTGRNLPTPPPATYGRDQ